MPTEELTITPSEGASGAWADLQAGSYVATLVEYEAVGPSTIYPDSGDRLKLVFSLDEEMDEETGEPIRLFYYVTQKLTSGTKESNLWKVATALGATPAIGKAFAMSTLLNRRCQVTVNIKGADTDAPRPFIAMVLPLRKAKANAASEADTCAVEGCTDAVGKYTKGGKPLCASHTADDL